METWAKGVNFKNSSNTKNIGGVGVYGNGTTTEKLYIGLGEEPWDNKGLQLTNNEINFKGNKIYHAGNKPSLSELGAAEVNHTHSSLSGVSSIWFHANSSDGATIKTTVSDSVTYLDMFMYDDVNQDKFRWRFKPHSSDSSLMVERSLMELYCKTASTTNTAHLDIYGSLKTTDTITAPTFSGSLTGNASSATKLQNAKTINGVSFDGTQNITIKDATKLNYVSYNTAQDFNNIKTTGVYSCAATMTNSPTTNHGTLIADFTVGTPYQIWIPDNSHMIYKRNYTPSSSKWGTWNSTLSNSISGNSNTATTLATARTFTVGKTGKTFNGSANVSWTLDEIGALDKFNDSKLASEKKIFLGHTDSWITGSSNNATVNLEAGGILTLIADRDCSNASEYVSLKAGKNDLKVTSSGFGTGQDKLTFNGNIVYHAGNKPSPSDIGAAKSDHTHNYVPTSGGNVTWINPTGYTTTNTSGSYANQWTKIATVTIDHRYSDSASIIDFIDAGSGSGIPLAGRLYLRVKQQSDMGSAPAISLYLMNHISTGPDNFKTVTVVNTASKTIVQLWFRNTVAYSGVSFFPCKMMGVQPEWHFGEKYQTGLPSGVQTSCSTLASVAKADIGTILDYNAYSNLSDEKITTNIEEVNCNISNKINKIKVYNYNYLFDYDKFISSVVKNNIKCKTTTITRLTNLNNYKISLKSKTNKLCKGAPEKRWGVIAQEVEELFPELITESKTLIDGENKIVKSVDGYGLTVLTLEFAKEIYKENQSLKEEIKLIKEKLGL